MTKTKLNFNLKNPVALVITILLITDITILVDIPVLRQIFGFLCFTILPGLLILYALKCETSVLKKFLLSIGLSISFLMFFGLLINTLYPLIGISRPLSTLSLVVSLNIALILLCLVGYKRNREDLNFSIFNIKSIGEDSFISPLLFPILFPFLSIFGTYLMNTEGNNIILMTMLFLIPIYVAFVVYMNKQIPKIVYPIAILMISISLLLMHGLRSNYVIGSDVNAEYYAFQVVARNAFWSMSNFHNVLTACLSVSLLPAIYQSILNMSGQYIFKLVYQLIFSITPLAIYVLSKRYVGELYAFIAAIFFMSSGTFFYGIQSAMRTELAIMFFALAMIIFFDDEIDKLNRKIFFLIFMFSVIVSHYTTAYVFFFLFLFVWLMIEPIKNFFKLKNPITIGIVALLGTTIFFWYAQVTETSFISSTSIFFRDTLNNMKEWFFEEIKTVEMLTTFGHPEEEIPRWILNTKGVICNTAIALLSIGVIGSIIEYIKYRESEIAHLLMTVVLWTLAVAVVVMPYTYHYRIDRLYLQALVFLAISFVRGGEFVSKAAHKVFFRIKKSKANFGNPQKVQHASISKYALLIIMLVLIPYFTCNTYLFYQIFGVPYSIDLNTHGIRYIQYTSDRDVIAAKWLADYRSSDLKIYIDTKDISRATGVRFNYITPFSLAFAHEKPFYVGTINNKTIGMGCTGYMYLRYVSVVTRDLMNINECPHLFVGKSKIYTNGGSEIYIAL